MRVTKVVLGLAGLLLMSLVFVSFQAAAHPEQSGDGIDEAREQTGMDPPSAGLTKAFGFQTDEWNSAMDTQIAHNPLCSGHGD